MLLHEFWQHPVFIELDLVSSYFLHRQYARSFVLTRPCDDISFFCKSELSLKWLDAQWFQTGTFPCMKICQIT